MDSGYKMIFENRHHHHIHHHHYHPTRIRIGWLKWHRHREVFHMGAVTCPLGQHVAGVPVETDQAGNVLAVIPANIVWSVDDVTIASFVQNADGSATFTALKAGVANATVKDTAFNLSQTDTFTVTDTPVGLAIQWGTPSN